MQRPDLYWSIAFSIFAFTLFILTQVMLQNVHITTTNGMWKSMDLQSFIDNPGWQSIDASNALLFPMHALFAWIFDQLGIFESLRWRQMAVTNGIFGAFGAGLCFFFALKWTQSHLSAVLIASAYCFSAHISQVRR